jgi:hypothetical protein
MREESPLGLRLSNESFESIAADRFIGVMIPPDHLHCCAEGPKALLKIGCFEGIRAPRAAD